MGWIYTHFSVPNGTAGGELQLGHSAYFNTAVTKQDILMNTFDITLQNTPPQAPDMFNPEVGEQTCGIIPKLYETKHKSNMRWIKSVVKGFSKIQPKMSKKNTF